MKLTIISYPLERQFLIDILISLKKVEIESNEALKLQIQRLLKKILEKALKLISVD